MVESYSLYLTNRNRNTLHAYRPAASGNYQQIFPSKSARNYLSFPISANPLYTPALCKSPGMHTSSYFQPSAICYRVVTSPMPVHALSQEFILMHTKLRTLASMCVWFYFFTSLKGKQRDRPEASSHPRSQQLWLARLKPGTRTSLGPPASDRDPSLIAIPCCRSCHRRAGSRNSQWMQDLVSSLGYGMWLF